MNSFLSDEELKMYHFKHIGSNVKISRFARFYCPEKIEIGNDSRIDDFCILSGKISLGKNVHIAAYSALYGGMEGVFIGDFSNISSRVTVYSISDDYSGMTMTNPTIPDEYKNVDSRLVSIGKHVIIGSTSVILPGVSIPDGVACGCFSFINRNPEEWSINAGIPFRKIGDRKKDLLELEADYLKSYDLK